MFRPTRIFASFKAEGSDKYEPLRTLDQIEVTETVTVGRETISYTYDPTEPSHGKLGVARLLSALVIIAAAKGRG